MENISDSFNNINNFINKLSSSFDSEVLNKNNLLNSIEKKIKEKQKGLDDSVYRLGLAESNADAMQNKLVSIEDQIVLKNKERDSISDKANELSELEKRKNIIISESNKIILERDSIKKSIDESFVELKDLQFKINKLSTDKIAMANEIEASNKILNIKNIEIENAEKNTFTLNNEISIKENNINVLNSSLEMKEKHFSDMEEEIKDMEKSKSDLDISINNINERLGIELEKLNKIKLESDLEKSKLKNEEDRLIVIRRDIQTLILNNRSQLDSRKIADILKSIENDKTA